MKLRILCRDLSVEEWSDHIHGAVKIEGILESWRTPRGWQVNMLVSYADEELDVYSELTDPKFETPRGIS